MLVPIRYFGGGGSFFEEVIEQKENYQPLNELVSKKDKR
jgi:hypothetical protein